MAFNRRERTIGILALIVVLAFFGDRFFVTPLYGAWKSRTARIADLEQSLEKGALLVGRERDIAQRWQSMKESSLPADPAAAEKQALDAVSAWAQRSRLDVTSLKPRWIVDDRDPARKIEFRVLAQGNLEAVARFLYALESAPALRVEDVEISSRDDRGRSLTLGVRFTGLSLAEERR